MKLALHSVSYAGVWPGQARFTLEQFLDKAKALGFEAVMLMAKRPHLSVLDCDSDARRAIRSQVERLLEASGGGFGGMMFRAHEWANREDTLKSYELFARYVMPRFQGSADTLNSVRSAPDENALPAPVRTIARTAVSRSAARRTSPRPCSISLDRALNFSG